MFRVWQQVGVGAGVGARTPVLPVSLWARACVRGRTHAGAWRSLDPNRRNRPLNSNGKETRGTVQMSVEPEPAGKGRTTGMKSAVAVLVADAEAAGVRLRIEDGALFVRGPRA